MNYDNRFVLFLDILGFKQKVATTYKGDDDIPEEIDKLYHALEWITKTNSRIAGTKRVTQFSDSIVISFSDLEMHEFHYLFDDISYMLYLLVLQGVLCRGAIAHGKFLHDERYLFGPALVDAYETETKAAIYPRVIMDKSVLDIYREKAKKESKRGRFKRDVVDKYLLEDMDEKYFIDYFYYPKQIAENEVGYVGYLEKLRSLIVDESAKAKAVDVRIKYGWMKVKFNVTLERLGKEYYETTLPVLLQERFRNIKPFN